jgi:hypothetical protein
MALSDHKYDASSSLYPSDTSSEFLHQFERETLDPQSAASDASVFAYAVGRESVRQVFTTQEREDAKAFLTEAFAAAGMSGKITTGDEYQPSVLPLQTTEYLAESDYDEFSLFEYGVR